MTGETQQYLRIFLGSPSDVQQERGIAYDVINDVEEILKILKQHKLANFVKPLSALGWEKVPPNYGVPNRVILDKFPIEESDIFIFILWERFGTPPRTSGAGGKYYSSGTEQEFIEAYELRRNNPNGRPIIMLYRKTDDSSLQAKDTRQLRQFSRVRRFFEECEPGRKYSTLVYEFKANEFEIMLRKHLLDNILNLYRDLEQEKAIESKQERSVQDESIPDGQATLTWLEQNNLSRAPFHNRFAEDESDISKYYVRLKNLQLNIDYLLNDKNSWLVFGQEGSGKTALRKFLVARRQNYPKVFCIEYADEENFLSAVEQEEDPEKIALSISIQICKAALQNASLETAELYTAPNPSSVFVLLKEKLKARGLEQILIFIDPFRKAVKNVSKVAAVLAQLATVSIEGIGLRFFLPKNIYLVLSNKQHMYIGRCTPIEIKWETNELLNLIQLRLIYYSKDKRNVVASMGALGEPKAGMDKIDQAIINLSESNPRAVIWLAEKLIDKHCQNQPIPLKIQRQSWDQVQEEWWNWGRNHTLGLPGQHNEFWQSGGEIFFKNGKLNLTKFSKTLMTILIDAEGQICSKEKIIEEGWKNESKEGVSEAAVREAVRRLKLELENNSIDPRWVRTIRNQGYQLQNPDNNPGQEDGEND
jgi:DNA-binding winged helix-turn-helix (wHTH) protein